MRGNPLIKYSFIFNNLAKRNSTKTWFISATANPRSNSSSLHRWVVYRALVQDFVVHQSKTSSCTSPRLRHALVPSLHIHPRLCHAPVQDFVVHQFKISSCTSPRLRMTYFGSSERESLSVQEREETLFLCSRERDMMRSEWPNEEESSYIYIQMLKVNRCACWASEPT